jgi:sporulation protein YlmC with PRC-barrel domain
LEVEDMFRIQTLLRPILVLSLTAALSGYVLADESSDNQQMNNSTANQGQVSAQQAASMPRSNVVLQRATRLIGSKVKSPQGETLGTIYDIVLTPDRNSISYVALSRGGIFGIGRKLYAVPWSAMQEGPGYTHYLPISAAQLDTGKGFSQAYWPTSAERGWLTGSSEAAEPTYRAPTPTESRQVQNRRVSKIIGLTVDERNGQRVGSIEDLAIRADDGQVAYTVVGFGGFLGLGRQYAAVPPTGIELQPEQKMARLDADRSTLQASAFSPMRWPDLSDPAYARRVSTLYGTRGEWPVLGYVPPQPGPAPETESQMPESGAGITAELTFNPAVIRTVTGTVIGVGKTSLRVAGGGEARENLSLRMRTSDNRVITIYLGPRDYIAQQDFYAVNGDKITATGSETTAGGQSLLLATQVMSNGRTLRLRDADGRPLWLQPSSTSRSAKPAETPERAEHVGNYPEEDD